MNTVIDFLVRAYKKHPDKTALVTKESTLSFKELFTRVNEFGVALQKFPHQAVVSILMDNCQEFVITYLGILKAGCIAHIISSSLTPTNLEKQIQSSKPKIIITLKKFHDNLKNIQGIRNSYFSDVLNDSKIELENKAQTDDIATLLYTSGTTDIPKGVPIRHSNIAFTTKNIIDVLGYNCSDIDVVPLPLSHSFGLGCLHTSLYAGSTLVLHKNSLNLNKIIDSIKDYSATTIAAVPATLTKIIRDFSDHIKDCSTLRLIITNSTAIPKSTVYSFLKILPETKMATYYGLTEASRSTFMIFNDKIGKEASVGLPAQDIEIKLTTKENDNAKEGEICIKGKNVIDGYWNKQFDNKLEDGWLKTGDLGYFDSEGYLYLKGRIDDIINVSGEKVFPEEVEEVVKELNGIKDATAIGMNHPEFGQVVKLFVQKSNDSDIEASAILRHCKNSLERHKIPFKIEFIDKFPRTGYGKVKRHMLR